MNTQDVSAVLSAWQGQDPWAVESLIGGGNNLTYRVASAGLVYLLRIYQNTAAEERVRYEHKLLELLARSELSFAVPAPLRASDGDTLVTIAAAEGPKLAALFPFIPGHQLDSESIRQVRACGTALGELDGALSHLELSTPSSIFPPFGSLVEIHPAISNPAEILDDLAVEKAEQRRLADIVSYIEARIPALYKSLPQQIVHRDFDASNILMVHDRVSGVLDFEFAGPDLRALDLACSLARYTSNTQSRSCAVAFVGGYRERQHLTPDEIDALPDLIRLYRLISMIHREGRRRQGLAVADDVFARARELLRVDKWLSEGGQQLTEILG